MTVGRRRIGTDHGGGDSFGQTKGGFRIDDVRVADAGDGHSLLGVARRGDGGIHQRDRPGEVGGFAFGYSYVAPTVISFLVADAAAANMIISYRITDFFWLIFYTTAGIGLLAYAVRDAFPIPGFNDGSAHTPWPWLLPAAVSVGAGLGALRRHVGGR